MGAGYAGSMSEVARRLHHYTYEDYRVLEEHSPVKHEFLDGEIYAMAGGTPEHAALAMAVAAVLGKQLPGGCRLFSSDLRVRVLQTTLTTYPDLTVVCGAIARDAVDRLSVTNPTLLVEITSDSSEDYDRGDKQTHFLRITTLRAYVVVSHREPRLDLWSRGDDGTWSHSTAAAGEVIEVATPRCTLSVDEVFRGILPSL